MTKGAIFFLLFTVACALSCELAIYLIYYLLGWGRGCLARMYDGLVGGRAVAAMRDCLDGVEVRYGGELTSVIRIISVFSSCTVGCYVFLDGAVRLTHVLASLALIVLLPSIVRTRAFCRAVNILFYVARLSFVIIVFIPYILLGFTVKITISIYRRIYKRFFVKMCQKR